MLSTMRAIPRGSAQALQAQQRRLLSKAASPPLMWRLAHGYFDFESTMTEPLPGVPTPAEIAPATPSSIHVTTLPNGVRVASQDLGGPVASVGLFIGAGSRDETPHTAGVTHALERLAFKGSNTRTKYRMIRDMERTGSMFNASASRDTIAYTAEGLRGTTADMVGILAESATNPAVAIRDHQSSTWDIAVDEIKDAVTIMKRQLKEFQADAAGRVTEAIHAAAFNGNSLGLPLVAEERKLDQLSPSTFAQFIDDNVGANNIVLSAANVDHDELVSVATDALGGLPPNENISTAHYTGGNLAISADGPAHIAIGFKGVSWADEALVPACVLYTLLGGGGSFSSGGPGKGMYTRLYSNVLNRHGWISSCMAFNHCYADAGLFGVHASCDDPAHLNNLVEVVSEQLRKISEPVSKEELSRAKAMTKSSLIMNLESRAVVAEDIGRQILSTGKYVTKDELVKRIDAVSDDDILKIARDMLSSKPSIVKFGEEYASYEYGMIESSIKTKAQLHAK